MKQYVTKTVLTIKGVASINRLTESDYYDIRIEEYDSDLMLLNEDKTLMNIHYDHSTTNIGGYLSDYVERNNVTRMTIKAVTGLSLEETLNPFCIKDTWYMEQIMGGDQEHTRQSVINTTVSGWKSALGEAILFTGVHENVPVYVEIYMESL